MNTEYSITLTPSHDSVPVLMDFIIDHATPPYPKRKELVDMLVLLDKERVRRLHIKLSKGAWHIEFIVNERVKFIGKSPEFDKALENALGNVRNCAHAAAE
jgi:hypothetical protein